jgi:hypothetical protein
MPSIRIVALAALILIVALAVILSVVGGSQEEGQLILLLIAAANAALVVVVTRVRAVGLAHVGLWLVMIGVAAMLAAETSPYWIERMLPRGDTIEDIWARFDMGLLAFVVPFWSGALAFILGWVLWIASRIAARRRAVRVVSELRDPI